MYLCNIKCTCTIHVHFILHKYNLICTCTHKYILICTCTIHVHFILHKYIPYMYMYTLYYISTSLICTCTVHVHFILHKYIPYMYMYCTCTLCTCTVHVHIRDVLMCTCTYKVVLIREYGSTLYVGMARKKNGRPYISIANGKLKSLVIYTNKKIYIIYNILSIFITNNTF